jgi:solute carrier family 13 (sodium-dependent dicarboxylate transporter), member 2/3/5
MSAKGSEAEESPISTIKWVGLGLGLAVSVSIFVVGPPSGLSVAAWHALAVLALMVIWWISEAIPVAATALVPLAALPILGIATPAKAAAPYADPIIYMFVGGFILAAAVEKCGLHRRIALGVLSRVGGSQSALVGGFMIATAALSMWISNTATSLMMTPIALAVAGAAVTDANDRRKLAAACVLGVAYASSVGGLGTPVGSPTNLVGLRWLEEQGVAMSFPQWMAIGLTIIALVLPVAWWLLTHWVYKLPKGNLVGPARDLVAREAAALGPMNTMQFRVFILFICVALAWIVREPVTSTLG